jgi:ribosomal protein S18 acetylase RimI-like enzyme
MIIAMFFITMVTIIYWWDWLELIEDDIQTTLREFVIDLVIILTIGSMFAFYDQPKLINILFIFLSLVNGLWVVNYALSKKDQHQKHLREIKTWIFQKLMAMVIYAIPLLITIWVKNLSNLIIYMMLIGTFAVVRYFCFQELKSGYQATIRPLADKDIPSMIKINQGLLNQSRKDGFLLGELTVEKLKFIIESKDKQCFVATNKKDCVLGYIYLNDIIDDDVIQAVTFVDKQYQNQMKHRSYDYIEQIAVDKQYQGRGIGNDLMRYVIEHHPHDKLYSFISQSPYNNQISYQFHQKHGFIDMGYFKADQFMGIPNYQSVLLMKKE